MCFSVTSVLGLERWNWEGDVIVHRAIVPSSRPALGFPRRGQYDIDPREFLTNPHNAVIGNVLDVEIPDFIRTGRHGDVEKFKLRNVGCFDYRADVIAGYVSEKIRYVARTGSREPWMFPEETLHVKQGDCEDRALVLASLLIASGISNFNVRVALGELHVNPAVGRSTRKPHVWVMYKDERGRWQLLEPTIMPAARPKPAPKVRGKREAVGTSPDLAEVTYTPFFLFNDEHLWITRNNLLGLDRGLLEARRRWAGIDPAFAGEVHRTILNDALAHLTGPDRWILDSLNRTFSRAVLGVFGPIVDDVDRKDYDPIEHFDNGYVQEGWQRVELRMKNFAADRTQVREFALAAHAVADFYAHTSWPHFAKIVRTGDFAPRSALFDPHQPQANLAIPIDYGAGSSFDLTDGSFSVNKFYWKGSQAARAVVWQNQFVSGRYAQRKDTQGGLVDRVFLEGRTYIPKELENRIDFPERGSLPHHVEIAVDEEERDDAHRLYSDESSGADDRMSYANQFAWRKNAATAHIRQLFDAAWLQA